MNKNDIVSFRVYVVDDDFDDSDLCRFNHTNTIEYFRDKCTMIFKKPYFKNQFNSYIDFCFKCMRDFCLATSYKFSYMAQTNYNEMALVVKKSKVYYA